MKIFVFGNCFPLSAEKTVFAFLRIISLLWLVISNRMWIYLRDRAKNSSFIFQSFLSLSPRKTHTHAHIHTHIYTRSHTRIHSLSPFKLNRLAKKEESCSNDWIRHCFRCIENFAIFDLGKNISFYLAWNMIGTRPVSILRLYVYF